MSHGRTLWPDRITTLHQQGFVTHVLSPPADGIVWSIDPQSVRDLDGLTLLVICDDGTVAVGCPDGLPAVLDGMATSLDPACDTAPPLPDAEEADAAGPSGLQPSLPKAHETTGSGVPQPETVEGADARAAVEATDDPTAPPERGAAPDEEGVAILARLDRIDAGLQVAHAHAATVDIRIAAELDHLMQRFSHDRTSIVTNSISDLGHAIRTLQGDIERDRADVPSHADLRTAVDDVVASIRADRASNALRSDVAHQTIVGRLDDLWQQSAAQDLSWLTTALGRQADVTERILTRQEAASAQDVSAGLIDKIQDMSVALDGIAGTADAVTALTAAVNQLSRDISASAVATPTAPAVPSGEPDNASLRQHIVRQGLVQSQLLRKLDRLMGALETSGATSAQTSADHGADAWVGLGYDIWRNRLGSLDGTTRLEIAEFIAGRMQQAAEA
ncbi:hypothetical protein SAMN04488003_10419 [Loktanella fryxellensis]|uniref:Uncharacterized protein n=1 Tax=Loktanella fryxellensis TaxID=245187 RepID=A0A1H8ASM3_9RHOB|nr:hypothetical protein SAMN04488003_10419 [Loktanella fryxellensis]